MAKSSESGSKNVSLAQAILAPLNAIFQAQVQASRAFLNYVLSMGFHHTYSQDEKDHIRRVHASHPENPNRVKGFGVADEQVEPEKMSFGDLQKLVDHLDALDKIQAHRDGSQPLEKEAFKELVRKNEGLFMQNFRATLADGSEQEIYIPTLSLIPMKPLAIDEASFKFVMSLNSEYSSSEGANASGAQKKRPWMAIEPRELIGAISKRNSLAEESTIEIEVKIASAPLPAGLDAMLTTLSQNVRTEKVEE